ncbi:hypothetical protein BKA65DRAFT_584300 [Rhexocercosporidium sp. MPI-PUGE-AT-0058]|nr:hypothetical protein BKA65DRAFT_584300 [Rhexocercosporidium sp. MPI-PUGE-AT-0058]
MDTDTRSSRSTASPSGSPAPECRNRPERNTVSSACIPCRSKHVKCDGLQPCSRCTTQGLQCIYLKSRRGYKGPAATREQLLAMDRNKIDNGEGSGQDGSSIAISNSNFVPRSMPSDPISTIDFALVNQNWATIQPRVQSPSTNIRRRCMEAFFQYFYDAHPFLPPRQQLLEAFKVGPPMDHLETAMAYIGSRYVRGASPASYSLDLDCFVLQQDLPRDASTVQTMLLFALGLDGNNERKKAVEVLIKAQRFALELGMNQQEYATINGRGSPICEESIRRTWWELYVVSVMVAAFHGKRACQVSGVISTTPLPCEEKDFVNGVILQLHTMEEFDDDSFLDEEIQWSSYAYRIAAARNLERILGTDNIVFPEDPRTYNLDALLVNWNLHLPPSKVANFDQSGTFDEMMFQAHMITDLSSLLLHRRFTPLDAAASQAISSCTAQGAVEAHFSAFEDIHSSKATQAASNISKLVGMPTPLIQHTHFFICALTHSSISHLSLWSHLPLIVGDENLKEEIRMNAGALRAMRAVWPSAQTAFNQVSAAAQRVFEMRKDAVVDVFWWDLIGDGNADGDGDGDLNLSGLTASVADVNS